VRVNTLLKRLLGIKQVLVDGFSADGGALVLDVRPSWRLPRCSGCHRPIHGTYDHRQERWWRHLDFGGVIVLLRYGLRRVSCPKCGVVVERVPWNDDVKSRFTQDFEDAVAYHTQRLDKTGVTHLFGIAWRTVGRIVERVVKRKRTGDPLDDLEFIGVDELSYRKHHRYLTLVTDHVGERIVWGREGKSAETLAAFFEALGEERCRIIRVVTMDMSQAYIKVVREKLPWAQIVFDRYHVEQLVRNALDKTRRQEWQRLRGDPDADASSMKHLRWVLLKNPWNLKAAERQNLSTLPKVNARLYRAYLLKESFMELLDRRQPNVVARKMDQWLSWASRSRLPEFVKAARTIRSHRKDILAFVRWRLSNGLIEGLNTKARLITRRAYGFHSAEATLAMIMLCCTKLQLHPIRKQIVL
jgi:transposase